MGSGEINENEATRSDSEDDDYDDRVAAASSRKRKVARAHTTKKPHKKRRRYDNSDDDILASSDEDVIDDMSDEGSYSADSINIETTASGRPRRAVTKNTGNLAEASDEEEEDEAGKSSDAESDIPTRKQTKPQSRIVKLAAFFDEKDNMPKTRSQARGSRQQSASRPPSRRSANRRSSRHSDDGDFVELSLSGKHARSAIRKSATPERRTARSSRALKNITQPSTIIEASQEDSPSQAEHDAAGDNDAAAQNDNDDEDMMDADVHEVLASDLNQGVIEESQDTNHAEAAEEPAADEEEDEEDDDEEPVVNRRLTRKLSSAKEAPPQPSQAERRSSRRLTRGKKGAEESSDFDPDEAEEPEDEDEELSGDQSPQKASQASSAVARRSGLRQRGKRKRGETGTSGDESADLDPDELADEVAELSKKRRTRRADREIAYEPRREPRNRNPVDYRIFKPEALPFSDDDAAPPPPSSYRNRRSGAGTHRSLLSTMGPFGGAGAFSMFGGPESAGAVGGADSDSSDDDSPSRLARGGIGGTVGMTPTSAVPPPFVPQTLNADPAQGGASGGGPSGMGRVKDKKALADADPLGVDQSVGFEGVGGLENHINQLKEMVALPLLYPEVFQQFKITPPRGVLFHGPPGTGKTLLARALAASVGAHGRKVTFYMRKGADALSKWVGEAERQLRLLFEEARKNQPSIIFFDEIDGLAPVRSSKQEQIHASIVATLLALMDGMDGRGQVIVIGATNRPDSVDPALRRPGRFDREFYFPLPDQTGRRSILDIHTRGWEPPLTSDFKDQLASLTKGYGGADLRALCTEAALNAVQGTYPQIYKSNDKLVIDPTKIQIQPKDFMISIQKMIPSSERSGGSGGAPLDRTVEPLLRQTLQEVSAILDDVLPDRPKRTALEEAEFDDRNDAHGFEREKLQQEFDRSRVYRPRLLIEGSRGMGQHYLGSAILHKFERLHVQSFDLATIFNDATRTPEAAVIQLFNEARRHRPSVIYLPNVNTWYETVGPSVIKTFTQLVKGLPPNDAVLVLGIMELESKDDKPDENMLRDLFGFSGKNLYKIKRPSITNRHEYFLHMADMIKTPPTQLPDGDTRPKRKLEELAVAPQPKGPEGPSKADLKARKKHDMHTLNLLKIAIGPIMEHIKNKYKKFRHPTIDESKIGYLFEEQDPNMITTDLPEDQQEMHRPYELKEDHKGVRGLLESDTGKFYYNIEIVTIERRLSNGYYKRPKDFLADIRRLAKDAKTSENEERTLKANELVANVEVDIQLIEQQNPALVAACEEVYSREKQRVRQQEESRANGTSGANGTAGIESAANPATTTTQTTGPIVLGEPVPGRSHVPFITPTKPAPSAPLTNGDSTSSHAGEAGNDDVQMGNSQEGQVLAGSGAGDRSDGEPKSQRSALTAMANNSQPGDYHNSASTTTSGQKTSDKSNQSWQPNTQGSNGVGRDHRPDFSGLANDYSGQSQLPDTQGGHQSQATKSEIDGRLISRDTEMQHSSSQSQADGGARNRVASQTATSLANIMHPTDMAPKLIINEDSLQRLHDEIVHRTVGCTIEQLEQINAAMMDTVWRNRSQWNRDSVLSAVSKTFNEVIADIEQMQSILPHSQSSGRSHEGES